jgi:hypothetical protein
LIWRVDVAVVLGVSRPRCRVIGGILTGAEHGLRRLDGRLGVGGRPTTSVAGGGEEKTRSETRRHGGFDIASCGMSGFGLRNVLCVVRP